MRYIREILNLETQIFYNGHEACHSFVLEEDIIFFIKQWINLSLAENKTLYLVRLFPTQTLLKGQFWVKAVNSSVCKTCRNMRGPWRIVSYTSTLKSFSSLKKKPLPRPPFSFNCYLITSFLDTRYPSFTAKYPRTSICSSFSCFSYDCIWTFITTPEPEGLCQSHPPCRVSSFHTMTTASFLKLSLPLAFLNSHGCTVLIYFLVAPPSLFSDSSFSTY